MSPYCCNSGGLHHRACALSPFPSRSPVSLAYSRCQTSESSLRRRARFLIHCGTSMDIWETGDTNGSVVSHNMFREDGEATPTAGPRRLGLSASYLHLLHIETQTQSGKGFGIISSSLSPDGAWAASSDNQVVKLYSLASSDTVNPHLIQCERADPSSPILSGNPSNCLCFTAVQDCSMPCFNII